MVLLDPQMFAEEVPWYRGYIRAALYVPLFPRSAGIVLPEILIGSSQQEVAICSGCKGAVVAGRNHPSLIQKTSASSRSTSGDASLVMDFSFSHLFEILLSVLSSIGAK